MKISFLVLLKKIYSRDTINNNVSFRHDKVMLNVGGAKGHPKLNNWITVDIRENADIVIDISKERLPFENDGVDFIYTSHTLEHIYPKDLPHVLSEFKRVIKPKTGVIRIVVPDIEKACRAYVNRDIDFFMNSSISVFDKNAPIGGYLMSWFYSCSTYGNGHVHCFDYEYLTYLLKKAGFRNISKKDYKISDYEEFLVEGLELPRYK
ncbi:MAG: class I SAM-dependent methyltransferase, partial [Candidatus Helarchaeota archaeon]